MISLIITIIISVYGCFCGEKHNFDEDCISYLVFCSITELLFELFALAIISSSISYQI